MKITKALCTAALASAASAVLLLASSGPAAATHTHVKVVGNGGCVILAQDAGEAGVDLPTAVFTNNPHAADVPQKAGRTHPLHVLVHQGVPGDNMPIYVLGSSDEWDACGGSYINR